LGPPNQVTRSSQVDIVKTTKNSVAVSMTPYFGTPMSALYCKTFGKLLYISCLTVEGHLCLWSLFPERVAIKISGKFLLISQHRTWIGSINLSLTLKKKTNQPLAWSNFSTQNSESRLPTLISWHLTLYKYFLLSYMNALLLNKVLL